MSVTIRPSMEEDVEVVASKLRDEDRLEVLAQGHESAEEAIRTSFDHSTIRLTLEKDGLPIAMFGLSPSTVLGNKANIWMLGTNEVSTVKKTFCQYSRKVVKYFTTQYPILWAQVDGRYFKAHRWLEWLGATKSKSYVLNSGVKFHDFYFRGA